MVQYRSPQFLDIFALLSHLGSAQRPVAVAKERKSYTIKCNSIKTTADEVASAPEEGDVDREGKPSSMAAVWHMTM